MDNNDANISQGGEPAMDAGDWRSQLQADSRQRIINKILDTLKRQLPFSGQEGLHELKKVAVRFEEKIYDAATSQSDYLRKISLKMLTMETRSQKTMSNPSQSNSAESSGMQSRVINQGQLLSENIQSNILPAGVQYSSGSSSLLAPPLALNMSALQSALPPSLGGNMPASFSSALPSSQDINMSGSSYEMFPSCGLNLSDSSSAIPPTFSLNLLANSQRHMQGWEQVITQQQSDFLQQQQQQQQQQHQHHHHHHHHQLQQELIQNYMQQQMLFQKTSLSSSQQSHDQSESPAVKSSFSRLQQNQQSAISQLMLQQRAMQQQLILPPQHQQQQLIASLDSTDQIGDKNGADWQEEVYQRIKVMKEIYLTKLSEIYQKNANKLQQLESRPQQAKSCYQLEKLKMLKSMLEHLITVLQVSKRNISPVLKGKLGLYEKQIITFINTNKPKKPDSSLQQVHLHLPHMHSMEHSEFQTTQVQSNENQMCPQLQAMNLQGSVATMQQKNVIGLQQISGASSSAVPIAQQNTMNPFHSTHVNSIPETHGLQLRQKLLEQLNIQGQLHDQLEQEQKIFQQQRQQELQQQLLEPQLHQITVVKDMDMNAPSSDSGNNVLRSSADHFKLNSDMVNNQHLKQGKEQKVSNRLKNPYEQLLIQHLQRRADEQLHLIYLIHFIIFLTIVIFFFGNIVLDY